MLTDLSSTIKENKPNQYLYLLYLTGRGQTCCLLDISFLYTFSCNIFKFVSKRLELFSLLPRICCDICYDISFFQINDFFDHTSSPVDGITLSEAMHARWECVSASQFLSHETNICFCYFNAARLCTLLDVSLYNKWPGGVYVHPHIASVELIYPLATSSCRIYVVVHELGFMFRECYA